MNQRPSTSPPAYDLVIVGAGIAGLNALHVATEHLPPTARVLLVDKKPDVGGMWNTTYDHVRLHQPYELFTVGDIPWKLGKDRSHLADRFEVLEHFRYCRDLMADRVDLEERYGHAYVGHREVVDPEIGAFAEVSLTTPDGAPLTVRTKRFVLAIGLNAPRATPLVLSSDRVRSATPESWGFLGEEMAADDAPIYVIGGGKTGTDAVYHAAKRYPGRRIVLLAGGGTAFFNRDRSFPNGLRRYVGGERVLGILAEIATRCDGDNQTEVFEWFVDRYGLTLDGIDATDCVFRILSEEEKRVIDTWVDVRNGYFQDVVDGEDGPTIVMRDGSREPIPPGTWIVNCTGVLLRSKLAEGACLSPHRTVLNVTSAQGFLFLSSISAFFLGHLWWLDRLHDAPLWLMDHQKLSRGSGPHDFFVAGTVQTLHNILVAVDRLPPTVSAH
jgi:hypothetical protein